jgi:penicillin amidase
METGSGVNIEVYRDTWGIPHLRAGSAGELAFAQGRNAAHDRAWQIEVERHRAQGTTAAFLGAGAVGWDVFARRARLEDTARRCFERLDPATRDWVAAYVDGVNDGLAEGARRAPQFAATGLTPGAWQPWTPLAIWLCAHILFAGFPAKLWREEVARRLGEDAIALFATDGPATSGSNGWLITGEHTATGAPLLAGDPHRFIEDPGVYQQIHLACPEFDVVGLAVPGVPGLAHFGHTGTVAWAITNAMADYQDLYEERLRRTGDGIEALGTDGWRPAAVHTETVEVAGGSPVEVEIVETERGPVVIGGPGEPTAVSLRTPPRVTAELGFAALPALLRAATVDDVDAAFDHWAEPVNVVQAADTRGGLLHRTAGRVPVRHRDNSLRVVPAWESGHAWSGEYAAMPRETVGAGGIAVMANARGIAGPLGVEFAPPHRADRIRELLGGSSAWCAKDMAEVHTDTHLASAAPLLDLLAALGADAMDTTDPDGLGEAAARLRDRLLRWDRRMDADSADAALFAAVRTAVVRRIAAHPSLAPLAGLAAGPGSPYPELFAPWLALLPRVGFALEFLLTSGHLRAGDRDGALRAALEEVAAEGPTGTWGERHRLVPWQALPGTPDDDVWPGLSGDHDCVLATSGVPGVTDLCARASAARYVWDLARREDSLWVVPLGASGVPGHPHHRDQLPLWACGELVPVVGDWDDPRLTREPGPYERAVEGFGTVRVVPVDPERDAGLIHSWVTQERARFWGMLGHSRADVAEIYAFLDSLPTHHAFLVHLDGRPVALFQTYDPAADPVGECYDVEPGDVGIHLLVGPAGDGPRPGFTGTLLEVLLDRVRSAPGVRRVVVDPDARNAKGIARFVRSGFVPSHEVDKPEKRALLAFLTVPAAPPAGRTPGTAPARRS